MFHVITGGSGSGKSFYAEQKICEMRRQTGSEHMYYIATMFPHGKEVEKKIRRHRSMRAGKGFETVECFTGLQQLVRENERFAETCEEEGICVLLECMSNLTANECYLEKGAGKDCVSAVMDGIEELLKKCRGVAVVTNEVFSDLKPDSKEMETYLKALGEINCRMAQRADRVTEVVYGIEVEIKG